MDLSVFVVLTPAPPDSDDISIYPEPVVSLINCPLCCKRLLLLDIPVQSVHINNLHGKRSLLANQSVVCSRPGFGPAAGHDEDDTGGDL